MLQIGKELILKINCAYREPPKTREQTESRVHQTVKWLYAAMQVLDINFCSGS